MEGQIEGISTLVLLRITLGILMGTTARLMTLRIDSRQVPSFPTGYFINVVTGFFAASLGAVAIPALFSDDYAAVTFLMLAVQNFRDIRKQTLESLATVDTHAFAPRGASYIDGISKTFESRNYISLLTSFGTVLALYLAQSRELWENISLAIVVGSVLMWGMLKFTKGKCIGDICTLHIGEIEVKNSQLYVDGIMVTALLGLEKKRALFLEQGIAVVATPNGQKQRLTLENEGQRQAMIYDISRTLGTKELYFSKRSLNDGRIVIALVPILYDKEEVLKCIRNTPILESVRKRAVGR